MTEDAIVRDVDFQPRYTRMERIISGMAEARQKPRSIDGREMVPAHVREAYEQRWQAEDRALFVEERTLRADTARRRRNVLVRFRDWLFGERC